mmetsp:Transcript_25907/g.66670  ORF Transcript_25907/g.66670 Transcript_25907/m.66670 type:complete len:585 (+) Transcript_25907:161-1915(+)
MVQARPLSLCGSSSSGHRTAAPASLLPAPARRLVPLRTRSVRRPRMPLRSGVSSLNTALPRSGAKPSTSAGGRGDDAGQLRRPAPGLRSGGRRTSISNRMGNTIARASGPNSRQESAAVADDEDAMSAVSSEEVVDAKEDMSWKLLVALCSVGILICYADRSNIATAILPMAKDFHWDKSYQGFVLSAFFSGYMLTQILGGRLADQYGGKSVLAVGVSIWSLCTVATPWAASWGTAPLLACRVALGVGEGVAFPAIHSLIAVGVPRKYQSTSVAAVTAASYLGTAAAFGISPAIIEKAGWEWSFYLFGAAAVLWLPLWLPFDPPRQALPFATGNIATDVDDEEEEDQEEDGGPQDEQEGLLGLTARGADAESSTQLQKFVSLLKQREVLAICVTQYTQSWGLYGLINWLPTFFSEYYHVEISQLGGLTMLPYVVQGGMGAVSGVAADALITRGASVRTVRVTLQVLGMLGPAACLVAATSPLTGSNAEAGSLIITIGLGLSALTLGGVSVSHLDIAPRNAGLVFGAGNTLATLAGLLAVPVNGLILDATGSWSLVFGLTAAHYVVGSILWAAWAGQEPLKEDSM